MALDAAVLAQRIEKAAVWGEEEPLHWSQNRKRAHLAGGGVKEMSLTLIGTKYETPIRAELPFEELVTPQPFAVAHPPKGIVAARLIFPYPHHATIGRKASIRLNTTTSAALHF